MKHLVHAVLAGVLLLTVSPNATEAASFAGTSTLNTANDLTLIDTDTVQLQFLDLTVTTGLSSSAAASAFAADGFGLATLEQVNTLFAAFGIDPFPAPSIGALTAFNVTPDTADIAGLKDLIGRTSAGIGTSIGRFRVGDVVGELCINTVANCSLRTGWVFGTERSPSAGIGNFLVREVATAPIPLPAPALLLVAGLGGLFAVRRRAKV